MLPLCQLFGIWCREHFLFVSLFLKQTFGSYFFLPVESGFNWISVDCTNFSENSSLHIVMFSVEALQLWCNTHCPSMPSDRCVLLRCGGGLWRNFCRHMKIQSFLGVKSCQSSIWYTQLWLTVGFIADVLRSVKWYRNSDHLTSSFPSLHTEQYLNLRKKPRETQWWNFDLALAHFKRCPVFVIGLCRSRSQYAKACNSHTAGGGVNLAASHHSFKLLLLLLLLLLLNTIPFMGIDWSLLTHWNQLEFSQKYKPYPTLTLQTCREMLSV